MNEYEKNQTVKNRLFVIIAMLLFVITIITGTLLFRTYSNQAEPKKVSVSEKQDLSNMTLDKTSEFYKIEFNLDPKFGSPEGE